MNQPQEKKYININKTTINSLNALSEKINNIYGFVEIKGENFGEPAINSGPCGPFANEFYKAWNARFKNGVKVFFVMQKNPTECHHIGVLLPDGSLYDGGLGIHEQSVYLDKGLTISIMDNYSLTELEKNAYGLERSYSRFCPGFNVEEVSCWIKNYLDTLC